MAITAADIHNQSFSIDRKGYDVDEVDVFLEHVADEIDILNDTIAQLQAQLEEHILLGLSAVLPPFGLQRFFPAEIVLHGDTVPFYIESDVRRNSGTALKNGGQSFCHLRPARSHDLLPLMQLHSDSSVNSSTL